MNANESAALASYTLDGSMPFPGAVVVAPITIDDLPPVVEDFDVVALKAAILDSRQKGQKFRDFCGRAKRAGVQGYIAYLRGKRVTYFGRQGDQHTEWFPEPNATSRS